TVGGTRSAWPATRSGWPSRSRSWPPACSPAPWSGRWAASTSRGSSVSLPPPGCTCWAGAPEGTGPPAPRPHTTFRSSRHELRRDPGHRGAAVGARPADVAIRAGRIMAVGAAGGLSELADRRTVRIDARGAAVLPGFHDAHVHPLAGGVALLGCDLSGVHSLEGYRELIAEHAARSGGPCVAGSGWFGDAFPGGLPDRRLLDELVPDR